ncbi:MAG: GNAT family N-acetyltransferase [Thermoanaerobacteraceae bacterium]|nr:GNAT family N-acetyltransferase [Thermoanaerobacteraceae bacterium]
MLCKGEKTNLRSIKATDFSKIIKWQRNELLKQYIGNKLPMSFKECEIRYLASSNFMNRIFGIEDKNGNLIGEIEINQIKWRDKQAELFLYIGEKDLWGKGYGCDALNTFLNYIFNEKNFKYLYLRVYEHNIRAIKCYEKCGFKRRGILRFNKKKIDSDNLILMDIKSSEIQDT